MQSSDPTKKHSYPSADDLIDGHLLLIDKPMGWTSFDVVNKVRFAVRRATGIKKIKVGHSGTLDPMATGLLLIATGKGTKQLESLMGMDKTYIAEMTLGATTPSYDAETEPDATFPYQHITPALMSQAVARWTGPIEQVPPMFSAIKVDGQPLYKSARAGKTVELEPRKVTIHSLELLSVTLPKVSFKVDCSKGTYIRSLAFDLGKSLESGAYLTALQRTKIGDYSLESAWRLEALIQYLDLLGPSQ